LSSLTTLEHMGQKLLAEDARQSLNAHVAERGGQIRAKYGPSIGWNELLRILQDRSCVRYPCEIVFDQKLLLPGEFAHPVANGAEPEDGFIIYVHPFYSTNLDEVPFLVLYQLVLVNYGPFASASDAEAFGANALGLSEDGYYRQLCTLADAVQAPPGCGII
jgi:hypothetical protein